MGILKLSLDEITMNEEKVWCPRTPSPASQEEYKRRSSLAESLFGLANTHLLLTPAEGQTQTSASANGPSKL